MKKLLVKRSDNLKGTVDIHGAKNSVLPIMIGSLLVDGKITLENVPDIEDVRNILEIFDLLEISYSFRDHTLIIESKKVNYKNLLEKNIKKLRASTYFMGTFLSRYKYVNIVKPGGCDIGKRPIDFHLNGFKKLNAEIEEYNDNIKIIGDDLIPTLIHLEKKSVGATINLLFASTYLDGVSVIENPSTEPEVDDVIDFLNSLGFKCFRIMNHIVIEGKKEVLKDIDLRFKIMSDRIETLTYIAFGLKNFDELIINNVELKHLDTPLEILKKANAKIDILNNGKTLKVKKSKLKGFSFETKEYPNCPTDIMQIFGVLQILIPNETSSIKENIFENRFKSFTELEKLGANLSINENEIKINGISSLNNGTVVAEDLRGSAALLLAGLNTNELIIENFEYIYRGYDSLLENLIKCNAKIDILSE